MNILKQKLKFFAKGVCLCVSHTFTSMDTYGEEVCVGGGGGGGGGGGL